MIFRETDDGRNTLVFTTKLRENDIIIQIQMSILI